MAGHFSVRLWIPSTQGGLSYAGWRLTLVADTLVGRKYHFWDMDVVETDAGPATGDVWRAGEFDNAGL